MADMAGDSRPTHNTPEKLPAAQQRQSQSAVVYQRPAADLISLVALCYAPGRALWENGDLLELGVA